MEHFSKQYAAVQTHLMALQNMAYEYENSSQDAQESEKIIALFKETYTLFCHLLARYLTTYHKGFIAGISTCQTIEHARQAGFLAEHDTKILLEADRALQLTQGGSDAEHPVIHFLETYQETMQTIMSEIRPQ